MVQIVNYKEMKNNKGDSFLSLILQGEMEVVTSERTGKTYVTARKATIASTFNEATCASLVGKELPGSIQRVSCEPYEYTLPDTGETIELDYRWEYTPVDSSKEHSQSTFSNNGLKAA